MTVTVSIVEMNLMVAAGVLGPGHVVRILHALQKFFVVLDGDDAGGGFALARRDFGFGSGCFYGLKFIGQAGRRNSCFSPP